MAECMQEAIIEAKRRHGIPTDDQVAKLMGVDVRRYRENWWMQRRKDLPVAAAIAFAREHRDHETLHPQQAKRMHREWARLNSAPLPS